MYLQGFKKQDIRSGNGIVSIGDEDFALSEFKNMLVFSDEDVLIYNLTSLVTDKPFDELLSDYIAGLNKYEMLIDYDFTHAYELGEILTNNIQDIIKKVI